MGLGLVPKDGGRIKASLLLTLSFLLLLGLQCSKINRIQDDWRIDYIQSIRPAMPTWEAKKILLAVDTYSPKRWRFIVLACIEEESKFNRGVVGDDGNSLGLMQVQMRTARFYDPKVVKEVLRDDTNTNLRVGIGHLEACDWNPQVYNAGRKGARMGRGIHHLWKVSLALDRMTAFYTQWLEDKENVR